MLGDRHGNTDDIRLLEGVRADKRGAHLAGDGHHGNGVHLGVHEGGHQVGCAGAGGGDTHADLAGRHGVAFRRMPCSLLMAHEDVPHLGGVEKRIVGLNDGTARKPEDYVDAKFFQ